MKKLITFVHKIMYNYIKGKISLHRMF